MYLRFDSDYNCRFLAFTVWPNSDVPKSDTFLKYSRNSSKIPETYLSCYKQDEIYVAPLP